MRSKRTAVFVGPTSVGLDHLIFEARSDYCNFFAPIQRGDLPGLRDSFERILIVDGYFQGVPAVGHAEIRHLLDHAEVYGCSSLGAIRAFEMRDLGMVGLGAVYQRFFDEIDFTDDEVAHLHGPAPRYTYVSEPLINIRYWIERLVSEDVVSSKQGLEITRHFAQLYFGDRSHHEFRTVLNRVAGVFVSDKMMADLKSTRIKQADFAFALRALQIL